MICPTLRGSFCRRLPLPENQVHIWFGTLDMESVDLNLLESALSPDEWARASRFHFCTDRRRFVVAHAILRQILSRYLGREGRELQFGCGPYGKPYLRSDSRRPELRFNLTHSHGMALYGITRNREIGVDLERIDRSIAGQQIAERFFSRQECSRLRTLPASQQMAAFFDFWTRKEAYVKATGAGLHMRLDSFDLSLVPDQPPKLLNGAFGNWSIHAPKLVPGYAAAIVVQGTDCDFTTRKWDPTPRSIMRSATADIEECGIDALPRCLDLQSANISNK
jgi:4'-phosphopantetheinyl transferase